MDEPASAAAFSTVPTAPVSQNLNSQQQPQLFHHQLMLLHQFQQQQQQQQQNQHSQQQLQPNPNLHSLQQQQQQSIMSRFPSNIDAHLRPPGIRSSNFNHFNQASIPNSFVAVNNVAVVQHQMQQIQQQQAAQTLKAATTSHTVAAARQGENHKEVELAQQDAMMVTNPDLKRPFDSIDDAVNRLLPYHVLADYEAEEEDDILNNDSTGQALSRQQQWDHTILSKIQEFNNTFEKQAMAFNIMTRKRRLGEFRSEERLMIEQLLLQDELQAINGIKAEQDSKERADREAAGARMRMAMAQAEQSRAQAQMTSGRLPNPVMRSSSAVASQGDDDVGGRNEEPTDDFLNDDNEDEEADEDEDDDDEDGELDLNERQ